MLISNLIYFIIACLVLIVSGSLLVKSLSKISRFLRISEFTAAFIIMAFATSVPELSVGISSALSKVPALSLGNVIGANILNLTLVTGIIVLISKKINIRSEKINKDLYFMLASIILLIILYTIGKTLSRIDGLILLTFFSINIYKKFQLRKKFKTKLESKIKRWDIVVTVFIFTLVLIILFLSSKYVVKYASLLALDLNFPKIIVGLFLLSIATTLPELVFGISAIRLKHKEMGIGDQVGSVVTNATLILGIVALISPIKAEFLPFITSALFMFVAGFIFFTFAKTGKKLERIEGISLILIYVLFVIIEFFVR